MVWLRLSPIIQICKDKEQAETWFLALKVVVSASHNPPSKAIIKHTKGTQSVAISPIGHGWRKHNGEFLESSEKLAQVDNGEHQSAAVE